MHCSGKVARIPTVLQPLTIHYLACKTETGERNECALSYSRHNAPGFAALCLEFSRLMERSPLSMERLNPTPRPAAHGARRTTPCFLLVSSRLATSHRADSKHSMVTRQTRHKLFSFEQSPCALRQDVMGNGTRSNGLVFSSRKGGPQNRVHALLFTSFATRK